MENKKPYMIVRHSGRANATFKVTNPKKFDFWKMIAEKSQSYSTMIITEIMEDKTK